MTSVTLPPLVSGAAAGVSAASSATHRLHAGSVQFDTFVPTLAGDPSLKYASQDEVAANVPAYAAAFHAVQQVTTGAAAYRLGDTLIADVVGPGRFLVRWPKVHRLLSLRV